ncbi:MAG: ABC transporter ATP-binding protein [Caldilineaceae bacterium]
MNEQSISTNGAAAKPILKAEALHKAYGPRAALRNLSFSLQAGHILGFLGPNGAGKTTAIRILTTILEPTSGQFYVDGISSEHPRDIRRKIGVLPESLGFAKQMTGIECLTFFGQMYGRSKTDAKSYGMELLKAVGLEKRAKSLIGSYSRGMRQRLGIARSLVNDPVVVFFDEPTLGLDPRGQQELLSLVQWVARERNVGVVLCSHDLPEIEEVCDDVVILRNGRIIAQGTVSEVVERGQHNVVRVQVAEHSVATAREVIQALPNVVKVTPITATGDWLLIELASSGEFTKTMEKEVKAQILNTLVRADIAILSFESEGGRLQDVFFQLTEEEAE